MSSRPKERRWSPSPRGAYTLVDVAAAVVALVALAAWLVPATAGIARSSKEVRCLGNLARIGQANLIYAARDPADSALPVHPLQFQQCPGVAPGEPCFPPIYVGAYEWGGKSGRGRPDFVPTDGETTFLNSKYGTLAGFGPATRPLNDLLYPGGFEDHLNPVFDPQGAAEDTQLDLPLYRCPSDTGYTGIHLPPFSYSKLTSFDHFGTSYAANVFSISSMGGGEIRTNSPYLHRMSELISPTTTIAYMENNGRYAWSAYPDVCDFIEGIPGPVRGWHGKDWTFHAAFIDGHVDSIYMRGYRNPKVILDEPGQQNYRCVIIRGDNWQIDTLPLPPIPTSLWFSGASRASQEGGVQ